MRRDSEAGRAWPWLLAALVLVIGGSGLVAFDLGYLDRWVCEDGTCLPGQVDPATTPDTPDQPVLQPALAAAPASPLDADAVRGAIAPLLGRKVLGKHVGFVVGDLNTGEKVWSSGTGTYVPASTLKLFTSLAAMETLGSEHRFETTVLRDTTGNDVPDADPDTTAVPDATASPGATSTRPTRIVLVGGGDPYLARKHNAAAREAYPRRASVAQLARRTATALKAEGITAVDLGYDASLFTGPAVNPTWEPGYITSFVTTPVSALWVDQGADGWRRSRNPDQQAARAFAAALRKQGVRVNTVAKAPRPSEGDTLASVSSGTVAQIVQSVIEHSDNQAAEVLLRHVAIAEEQPATFEGGVAAVRSVLTDLGIPWRGNKVYDGSGLSRDNRVTLDAMLAVVTTASSLFDRYPVAGFNGSLSTRFVASGTEAGLGVVRAKTGTLSGVHAYAGTTTTRDGTPVAFVIFTDRVSLPKTLDARATLDRIAARLSACACSAAG